MRCEGRLYSPRKEDVVLCCENCEHHDPEADSLCELYTDDEFDQQQEEEESE